LLDWGNFKFHLSFSSFWVAGGLWLLFKRQTVLARPVQINRMQPNHFGESKKPEN
jgi:hypothetical protein